MLFFDDDNNNFLIAAHPTIFKYISLKKREVRRRKINIDKVARPS